MIGQENLINTLTSLVKTKTLPRFFILVGQKGGGKKTIATYIAHLTKFSVFNIGSKVDDIRNMVSTAYSLQTPTMYIISDADNMSEIAKNSLLKLCEEPPNNAYVVMTLQDSNNTLETILSRAQVYTLDRYKPNDLIEFYKFNFEVKDKLELQIIKDVCETPGQIKELAHLGIIDFDTYVDLVFNNIAFVSGSNALKIGSSISLNGEEDKYPLDLFFKAFMAKCLQYLNKNKRMYSHGIAITSKYLQELRYLNLNKSMLFDAWVLDIRKDWLEYAESDT